MTPGYSGTPLIKKLGIKPGFKLAFVHAPEDYTLLAELSGDVQHISLDAAAQNLDFVQAFYQDRMALEHEFPLLKDAIHRSGMIWVSWLKKSSKIPTDIDENIVRDIGLSSGLVDVKVAAVTDIWSGLKFVYRTQDR
jgi:hypothetical protein